jgi:hypothetical protein
LQLVLPQGKKQGGVLRGFGCKTQAIFIFNIENISEKKEKPTISNPIYGPF